MENLSNLTSIISNYTRMKAQGELRQLPIAERRAVKAEALQALQEIQRLYSSDNINTLTTSESLENANIALSEYTQLVDSTDSKTTHLFRSVFSQGRKYQLATELSNRGTVLLQNDQNRFNQLIQESVERLGELAHANPAEARQEARELMMSIAKGESGVIHRTISTTTQQLLQTAGDHHPALTQILQSPDLFTSFERKTGTLNDLPPVPIAGAIAQKLSTPETTTLHAPPDLEPTVHALREERLFRLQNLREVYQTTRNDPQQTVKTKYFPQTTAWYTGARRNQEAAAFELEMREIGQQHGIPVISDSTHETFSGQPGALTFDHEMGAAYTQDFVDFTSQEVRVPLLRDDERYGEGFIGTAILNARNSRGPLWTTFQLEDSDGTPFLITPPTQGIGWAEQVWQNDQSMKGISLAASLGVQPLMNLTYNEGGNTLIGSREDGTPFAIIGQDSYEASKALMEKDLGRPMTDQEVRMAFAIDYGVNIDNLHFVEQPGDFHLDMNMAIVGPNTIVVNDAVEAWDSFQEEHLARLNADGITNPDVIAQTQRDMRRKAIAKKRFEDKTAQDLTNQGFTVTRVGGAFDYKRPPGPARQVMNYFNMVTATTPAGKRLVVAMGVSNDAHQARFRQMLGNPTPEEVEIRFLDTQRTEESLALHGGISCRTKTL